MKEKGDRGDDRTIYSNPDAEFLGGINIALSAVTWALGMLLTRSLWFPIGWHAAWNFCQFFVMGMPNSGISVTDMEMSGATLLVSQPTGSSLWTGGGFGMEASLVRTIILVVMIGLMLFSLDISRGIRDT